MGYLLLLFLVVIGVLKIISLFTPAINRNKNRPSIKKHPNHLAETEGYYHNLQVARSQNDDSAEQFFLMGLMDSDSRQDDTDVAIDDDYYEDSGNYEDDEENDVRDEYGE